jgi:hypothetical protein
VSISFFRSMRDGLASLAKHECSLRSPGDGNDSGLMGESGQIQLLPRASEVNTRVWRNRAHPEMIPTGRLVKTPESTKYVGHLFSIDDQDGLVVQLSERTPDTPVDCSDSVVSFLSRFPSYVSASVGPCQRSEFGVRTSGRAHDFVRDKERHLQQSLFHSTKCLQDVRQALLYTTIHDIGDLERLDEPRPSVRTTAGCVGLGPRRRVSRRWARDHARTPTSKCGRHGAKRPAHTLARAQAP